MFAWGNFLVAQFGSLFPGFDPMVSWIWFLVKVPAYLDSIPGCLDLVLWLSGFNFWLSGLCTMVSW